MTEKKEHLGKVSAGSSFSAIFINRPVTTIMLSLVMIVLGFIGYNSMGVDLYPNVEFPFVLVQTTLPGASPEEIETSVTKIIEESVNSIEGIDQMDSYSFEGNSIVGVQFVLEKNGDVAAQEVRDKVNLVLKNLPDGIDPPVVSKLELDALPVLTIAVSGNRDIINLTELARKQIKENIENVAGVGSVSIIGGRQREVHVTVNPFKLASLNVPIGAVKQALIEQNVEIPGGRVESEHSEYTLRVLGRVAQVSDFANIFVANRNGANIKISDIGTVQDAGQYERASTWLNDKRTVSLEVKKQTGRNTLAVISAITERLEQIKPTLPQDISLALLMDQSSNIRASVNAVLEHLILGAILASIAVFIFMGSVKSTFIASLAIPTSVIGTFFFMSRSGFTLNNMTLLGLTVAVGIVIDDGIVMLENIYRHMEEYGKNPKQAALDGAKEITGAIIATTASILVIFLPLAYMSGIIGRFVRSYGLTVVFAIALSGVVALTLTPMLCAKMLKHEKKQGKLEALVTKVNGWLIDIYMPMLEWALRHRWLMVGICAVLLFIVMPLSAKFVGGDFLPKDDSGKFQINIEAPVGTSYEDSLKLVFDLQKDIKQLPYVKDIFLGIGISSNSLVSASSVENSYILVELNDRAGRKKIQTEKYIDTVRNILAKYDTLKINTTLVSGGPSGGQADVQYIISGPDINKLVEYATATMDIVRKDGRLRDLDISFSLAKPEFRVIINRDKAQSMGVKIVDISSALRTMVGGEDTITKYKEGDELYEVRLRAAEEYRDSKEGVAALLIPTSDGRVVRLDSVADIREGTGPTQIDRHNRQRQVTVSANVTKGLDIQSAVQMTDAAFKSLNPEPQYTGSLSGSAEEMTKMFQSFLVAFILAFMFKYMILAAQFESFSHPVAILVSLPLTLPFAVISLALTRESLNIFSLLGMFMLIGIVSKNSILQVDYTNTLRHKGLPRLDAILEANKTRLRPILMTTITLVMGVLPIVFGTGEGAASRRSLGIVVAGGQTLSLLITLLMTPVTYTLLDDLGTWVKNKFAK